jgi:predicted peroxiredoxin
MTKHTLPGLLLCATIVALAGCNDPQRVDQLEQRLDQIEQQAGALGEKAAESARHVGEEAGKLAEQATLGKPTLVINLTAGTDDVHRAAMGLHLAEHGLAAEREVVVFFNVKAVELARGDLDESVALEGTGPVRALVAKLIAEGAQGLVCPMCAKEMGVTEADLAEGIQMISDRMQLLDHLHANSVVFTY